jgi:hypothetical protein
MDDRMTPPSLPADNVVGPNCGVTCVAIAAGVSFKEAWATLRPIRRGGRGRWNGATNHSERKKALDKLGVKYRQLRDSDTYHCTLKNFADRFAETGKLYMVRTTGHVQMVKNGLVIDQRGLHNMEGWRARKRVRDVLIIGE